MFRENVVYIGYEAQSAAIMAASKENKSTVQVLCVHSIVSSNSYIVSI